MLASLLRGDGPTHDFVAWLGDQTDELATTAITAAELSRGAARPGRPRDEATATRELLESIRVLDLGLAAARRFGTLMAALDAAGRPAPALDGLIAAITLEHGGRLATGNVRDFGRIPGLEVFSPPAP